jgi:hypothetical protein
LDGCYDLLGVGETVFLAKHGSGPTRPFHQGAFGRAAEVNRHIAGVGDQTGDDPLRLRIVAADPLHNAIVPGAIRDLGLKPEVSVLKLFV